jgi:hypothetical protein
MIFRAGAGESADQLPENARPQFARADVIEEKKRLGPKDGNIVDAMIDKVLANGVVAIESEGDLELGPHAVGAGDQHGLAEFFGLQRKKAAEAAHFAQDLAAMGGGQQLGQRGFDLVAQIDVHPCRGISFLTHVRRNLSASAWRDKENGGFFGDLLLALFVSIRQRISRRCITRR